MEDYERNLFSTGDNSSDARPYLFSVRGKIMSCLIRGMEMPKDGEWVNVNICSDGSVYFIKSASNGFVFYGVRKGEAIEISPHGRLIDADALMNKINSARLLQPEIEDVYMDDYIIVGDWLRSAPTIIEAEEGET